MIGNPVPVRTNVGEQRIVDRVIVGAVAVKQAVGTEQRVDNSLKCRHNSANGIVEPRGWKRLDVVAGEHTHQQARLFQQGHLVGQLQQRLELRLGLIRMHPVTVAATTIGLHVPRCFCGHSSRQASGHHGLNRRGADLCRTRRRGEQAEPIDVRHRLATGRSRCGVHGEPSSLSRGSLGTALQRHHLHGMFQSAHQRRADLHHQRLLGQGLHHQQIQGRPSYGRPLLDSQGAVTFDARRRGGWI